MPAPHSYICPLHASSYSRRAAREAGAAASLRDNLKRAAYRAHDPDANDLVPLSHESFGWLGRPAMAHLSHLADIACRSGDVQRDAFVHIALRRLSVAMCKGNAHILQIGMQKLGRVSGGAVWYGNTRPVADM